LDQPFLKVEKVDEFNDAFVLLYASYVFLGVYDYLYVVSFVFDLQTKQQH
jgi:hypothetical protein